MMRALTLHQPYASAVALGLKRYETRHYPTTIRGLVAIHAGKTMYPGTPPDLLNKVEDLFGENPLPAGCILCVVELYQCLPAEALAHLGRFAAYVPFDVSPTLTPQERAFGDYSAGRSVWLTRNLRVLKEPIPCTGHQGWWLVPKHIEAMINEQLQTA